MTAGLELALLGLAAAVVAFELFAGVLGDVLDEGVDLPATLVLDRLLGIFRHPVLKIQKKLEVNLE